MCFPVPLLLILVIVRRIEMLSATRNPWSTTPPPTGSDSKVVKRTDGPPSSFDAHSTPATRWTCPSKYVSLSHCIPFGSKPSPARTFSSLPTVSRIQRCPTARQPSPITALIVETRASSHFSPTAIHLPKPSSTVSTISTSV